MDIKTVCSNIEFILKKRGISWYVLSQKTGISNSYTTNISHGDANLTIDKIQLLAEFLQIPSCAFFFHNPLFRYIVANTDSNVTITPKTLFEMVNSHYQQELDKKLNKGKKLESEQPTSKSNRQVKA